MVRRYSRLLGMAPRGFGGRFADYLERVHPEDAAARETDFHRLPERPAPRVPHRGSRALARRQRALARDLRPREPRFERARAAHERGDQGHHQRKLQESARAKAEQQLARVFDASPEYIVVVRAGDGMIVAANPAFERVTGYRAARDRRADRHGRQPVGHPGRAPALPRRPAQGRHGARPADAAARARRPDRSRACFPRRSSSTTVSSSSSA